MTRDDTQVVPYEPPELIALGTFHVATQNGDICIWGKTIGQPDYFQRIPITNCS